MFISDQTDYILSEQVLVLAPAGREVCVAVCYQPGRDRLVVEAVCRSP
jgi:hypothetical protein